MDWITGEKFAALADEKTVFYRDTHKSLGFEIPKQPFIFITHNSDWDVQSVDWVPDNCIRWFAQNVNVQHPKLESIPIGLENSLWFPKINKKQKMLDMLQTEKKYTNLLYINFNIGNFPKDRHLPYVLFDKDKWATVETGANGHNFDSYLTGIYNHKFVLCPRGNGIDTHRTWETLYMGSIPIEKRNINNQFYTDLPICFVDDWFQITEDFLEKEYERITNTKWNMDKLTFKYWKERINGFR